MTAKKIKPREKDAILSSLSAGVVPRIGLQHIQVGRLDEVKAIISDLEKLQGSGSAIRFITGDFGSGKTFFLTLANIIAHNKNIVTSKADISLERTLYARDGRAQSTFSEIMRSLSIRQKPNGGALSYILESWLSQFLEIESSSRYEEIKVKLSPLKEHVAGFDFIDVLNRYVEAYQNSDQVTIDSCLKWLRGEFKNITAAKGELAGIKTFINDDNYYDYLKLYSTFFEIAGYDGFLIALDELVTLTRQIKNVRERNYETILKILNDSLQGTNKGLMFLIGGTPDFIFCKKKGLHSYGALERRLARNKFSSDSFKDLSGPLMELDNLRPEEYLQLFKNIRHVFASGEESKYLVSDEQIEYFLKSLYSRIGADEFMNAGEATKSFVGVLNVLKDNPKASFEDVIGSDNIIHFENLTKGEDSEDDEGDDNIAL